MKLRVLILLLTALSCSASLILGSANGTQPSLRSFFPRSDKQIKENKKFNAFVAQLCNTPYAEYLQKKNEALRPLTPPPLERGTLSALNTEALKSLAEKARQGTIRWYPEDADDAFLTASREGSTKNMALLQAFNPDINSQDKTNGYTALHECAPYTHKKNNPMLFLVSLGTNITIKNNNGNTALQYAAEDGNHEGVMAILSTQEIPYTELQETAKKLDDSNPMKDILRAPCAHLKKISDSHKARLRKALLQRAGSVVRLRSRKMFHHLTDQQIGIKGKRIQRA